MNDTVAAPELLRSASQLKDASMADLLYTYFSLTGKRVKKFESRAVAERRVEMAMLSAANAAGHAGVPPGAVPQPLSLDELAAKNPAVAAEHAAVQAHNLAPDETSDYSPPAPAPVGSPGQGAESGAAGQAEGLPGDPDGAAELDAAMEDQNPFKPGTISHQLWVATRAMAPVKKREPRKRDFNAPRNVLNRVRITNAGRTKLQAGSVRHAVYKFIAEQPEGIATLAQCDAKFGISTRGHLQKLLVGEHIALVPEDEQPGAAQ